ncbi:hypothetical protein MF451_003752 [Salmonella enterica subsp. enterica serovar Saintpaul]|nr:hypothetical protein [Salmonella enterica subsp. enterica serovar Saintpaul]
MTDQPIKQPSSNRQAMGFDKDDLKRLLRARNLYFSDLDTVKAMARMLLNTMPVPVFEVEVSGEHWLNAGPVEGADLTALPDGINVLYALPTETHIVTPAASIRGDRFANDNGQYVIAGDAVYALMTDLKWHKRLPLSARDRSSLRLVERGYEIKAHELR